MKKLNHLTVIRFLGILLIITMGFMTTVGSTLMPLAVYLVPVSYKITEKTVSVAASPFFKQKNPAQTKEVKMDTSKQKDTQWNEAQLDSKKSIKIDTDENI